ncbi:MAG: hypothetical protein H7234_00485 [Herminiimonas sp.]|nr:hypothetical protein [Herminiimonas sp.]
MNRQATAWRHMLATIALLISMTPTAWSQPLAFSFGVIAQPVVAAADDARLKEAIAASDGDSLAFVVMNGVKSASEPCSDKFFFKRKELFQSAKNGLIVSLAASDWSACRNESGHSLAIERLNRVRDLFFETEFSFGASKLPLLRQASMPKFRAYVENVRWDIGSLVFATLHLPANNNDFLSAAGRNSEFEDRLIADREWLRRTFNIAIQKNAAAIVLFCDANPLAVPERSGRLGIGARRDGFLEIRKQLLALGERFSGRVLLIHGQSGVGASAEQAITWQGRIGTVAPSAGWLKVTVDTALPTLFAASQTGVARTANH